MNACKQRSLPVLFFFTLLLFFYLISRFDLFVSGAAFKGWGLSGGLRPLFLFNPTGRLYDPFCCEGPPNALSREYGVTCWGGFGGMEGEMESKVLSALTDRYSDSIHRQSLGFMFLPSSKFPTSFSCFGIDSNGFDRASVPLSFSFDLLQREDHQLHKERRGKRS